MVRFQWYIVVLLLCCLQVAFSQSAHNRLQSGDAHYDKKEYGKAEAAYKSAAGGYAASYNAGNAAYQQGKYEEAAELFRIAVNAGADAAAKSAAWYNMGNAFLQAGKYSEAVKAYESSLRQQPNRPDAKKNLQIAKRKQQQKEDPPPPPPQKPPPPPPPTPRPQPNYLDRAPQTQRAEQPRRNLSPEAAKLMLEALVQPDEQRNAQDYRELSPAVKPTSGKKDW
ncbi:MAG: tetratricopeptide repeat protein [Bacteroidetes bacterium]|nr:tetratricopeptide repeat protein [Bacteroidota bacterium]